MNFEIIETARLHLKGITPRGMQTIFENFSKDEIKSILGHRSEEEYQLELQKHLNGYSSYNRSFVLFLLTEVNTGSIIGRCGIHNWNAEHRRAEIGYVMHDEKFRRQGLMTEAVGAILQYGFTKMNLNRLEALVGRNNIPSLRIMKLFGFREEGVLREQHWNGEGFEDSVVFSKLLWEFRNSQEEISEAH